MAIDLVAVLRLDDQMTSSLNQVALAATAGFAAITTAAAASVSQFVGFDSAIRKTGAIAGANSEELTLLSEAALELGASTSKSATEVASAMAELAAGGMDVNSVLGAMPGIIAASEASGESLALASETVAAALSMWSMEAEQSSHVADVLAMAANMSAAGITDMNYALKYAGAPAATLGIALEETAAAIGLMTNAGIDGSSAGTSLRASLYALLNPSEANSKAMDALGFSITDSAGEMKSLSEIVEGMIDATNGMTNAQKTAAIAAFVGTEASSGFLTLMKAGPAEINKMTDALVNSGGAAAETAKQMMGGIGGALEEMSGAIETVAIRVGERLAPSVESFARIVAGTDFTPFINVIGAIGDAAGFVAGIIEDNWSTIAPILEPLIVVAASVATAFLAIGGVAGAFVALSAAISFISGPVAAVAAGIGLVAGLFIAFKDEMGPVQDFFVTFKQVLDGGLFTGILDRDAGAVGLAVAMATGIQSAFTKIGDFIATFKDLATGGLLTGILERDEGAVALAIDMFYGLQNIFDNVTSWISTQIEALSPTFATLQDTFMTVWSTIADIASSAWTILAPIFSGLWNFIQIIGDVAVIVFNNVLSPAISFLGQAFATLWAIAEPILTYLALAFETNSAVLLALWKNVLSPFVEFILTGVKNAFETFTELLATVGGWFDSISGKVSAVYDHVRNFADYLSSVTLPSWITEGVSTAVSFVGDVIGSKPAGTHYNGLDSVPYDGYVARLHRGEQVLTAREANEHRQSGGSSGGGVTIAKLADQIIVREDADIDRIADAIVTKIIEKRGGG